MPLAPVFMPNWYVGGNIGVSIAHDKVAANSSDSITQTGPGWSADIGYQFAEYYRILFAGELGFTQYHNSNETLPRINVASTEHFVISLH